MEDTRIMVGWTTVAAQDDARRLARGLIEAGLATCVQIDGPIESVYRWKGAVETAPEFRLAVKFPAARADELDHWIAAHHPYETPQWLCVSVDFAAKNYLKWVIDPST